MSFHIVSLTQTDVRETVEILCDGLPQDVKRFYWRGIDINRYYVRFDVFIVNFIRFQVEPNLFHEF